MKLKRLTAGVLALVLSLSISVGAAFAETWYLDQGSITVDTSSGKQMVSQGGGAAAEDRDPVITQNDPGTATGNTLTITGGGTANVTIEDVNINTDTESGIDIQGDTTANITARGDNPITTTARDSAAIHVSEGTLNLNTTEGSCVTAKNEASPNGGSARDGCGAGIGSDSGEDMSGSITLSGKGSVVTYSCAGAGIGSGFQGEMSGSVTTGSGKVGASSHTGAGIGSSSAGEMSGSVTTGSGDVDISSTLGAGIGSGYSGEMSGSVTTGSGDVDVSSTLGAGIGSGYLGEMSGSVTTGSGKVGTESAIGAGIGSGTGAEMSGSVTTGSGKVGALSIYGAGIGSGFSGEMSGTIIAGPGAVTANSTKGNPMGAGEVGSVSPEARLYFEAGAEINGQKIDSLETLKSMGLGIPKDQIFALNPAEPAPAVPVGGLFWVLSGGSAVICEETLEDGVLTVTAEAEDAELHITAYGLQQLQSRGVKTVIFKTIGLESSFEVQAVLGRGELVLTHEGGRAELTLGGEVSDLLS